MFWTIMEELELDKTPTLTLTSTQCVSLRAQEGQRVHLKLYHHLRVSYLFTSGVHVCIRVFPGCANSTVVKHEHVRTIPPRGMLSLMSRLATLGYILSEDRTCGILMLYRYR
jgi:hypothetical protein